MLLVFWIVCLGWCLMMMIAVRWLNSDLHGNWSLLNDWEWNMLLVNDRAVDWNMHWIRNWLLNVVRNLSDHLNWCWDGNFHWNIHSLLNMNWVWSGEEKMPLVVTLTL